MKTRKAAGLESRLRKRILTDRDVNDVVARVTRMFSPEAHAMMKELGVDPETTIRLSLLASKCRERRMELGWDLKQAAGKVGVPPYRIDAIESGSYKEISQKEVRLYIKLLDIDEWFEKWRKANRRVFTSLAVEPDRNTPWAKKVRGTNA
jgi:DNA-binding XRE family transcriptional regulator